MLIEVVLHKGLEYVAKVDLLDQFVQTANHFVNVLLPRIDHAHIPPLVVALILPFDTLGILLP